MKGVLRLAAEFAELSAAAETMEELTSHLGDVSNALGLPYFSLVHRVSLRRSDPRLIESSNYPPVWSERVVRGRLFVDDPILQASQRTVAPFLWSEADHLIRLTELQRGIIEQSHREGLGEGLTVPANVPGEPSGSCSFATRVGQPLPDIEHRLCAHLVGIHAFERARQLHGYPLPSARAPPLSPRERDCIRALVTGASDKLIARQLNLSPETVSRYLKDARAAYGATTRAELIVRALADGTADFGDAIPQLWGIGPTRG